MYRTTYCEKKIYTHTFLLGLTTIKKSNSKLFEN